MDKVQRNLSQRDDWGFISLLSSFKVKDYYSQGYIYPQDFHNIAKDLGLGLSQRESLYLQQQLFKDGKLDYQRFMLRLVPQFGGNKRDLLTNSFHSLRGNSKSLTFYTVQQAFNAKQHPEYLEGGVAEYQVKQSFLRSLKNYLIVEQGQYSQMSLKAWIRFFEYYAKEKDFEYL